MDYMIPNGASIKLGQSALQLLQFVGWKPSVVEMRSPTQLTTRDLTHDLTNDDDILLLVFC